MSDGVSVYECTSPDEVVDLLAGGQGVFGIALGRVWQEVAGELAELPAVRAEDGLIADGADELASRRAARKTGLYGTGRRFVAGLRFCRRRNRVIPKRVTGSGGTDALGC
jgi:hypothetical protein